MARYALTVSYNGIRYSGFAKQKNLPTVQGILEESLQKIYGLPIRIKYASRTDAGAHALGQVISYDVKKGPEIDKIPDALNGLLPDDIRIISAREVSRDFSPSKDAKLKLYRYIVYEGKNLKPFLRGLCLFSRTRLDVDRMNSACRVLCGKHDFSSVVVKRDQKENTELSLERAGVMRCDSFPIDGEMRKPSFGDFVVFELEAQRFLYKMVRSICGLLIEVGERKLSVIDVVSIIRGEKKWRVRVLPPDGLYLVRINYGENLCFMR